VIYGALADGVLIAHLAFIAFVMVGGLAVLRWHWVAFLHVPSFLWGVLIEFAGWICPLTPLELHLRALAGAGGYEVRFLEHYLLRLIYPGSLTRGMQIAIGAGVLAVNGLIYAHLLRRMLVRRRLEATQRRQQ
jgi:hypothetical protein